MSRGARISLIVILLGVGLAVGWWWAGDWGPGESRLQVAPSGPVAQESLGLAESPELVPEPNPDPVAVAEARKERRRLARLRRKEERANSPAFQEAVRARRSGLGAKGPVQLWSREFDRGELQDLGYDSAEIDRLQQRFEDARDLMLARGLWGPGDESLSHVEALQLAKADKVRLISELGDDAAAVLYSLGEPNAVILDRPKDPGRKAGLKSGDQLLLYNGEPIYNSYQYLQLMRQDQAAQAYPVLTFRRMGETGYRDFPLTIRHGIFAAPFREVVMAPTPSP